MYGTHPPPLVLEDEQVKIRIESHGESWAYSRVVGEDQVRQLVSGNPTFSIHPIEPLQLPKPLARALTIQFEESLSLGPLAKTQVFLTFPIEIGVFIGNQKQFQLFDAFCLGKPKYSLYGKAGPVGILCRHHQSSLYSEIPTVNPLLLGILRLNIHNTTNRWVTLTRVMLGAYGMKLAYNQNLVGMAATMEIIDRDVAEVEGSDHLFSQDMVAGHETYPFRMLSTQSRKITMEGPL